MPCRARRRSETYELGFFKKTLLFGMKGLKTMLCEINWWNWVRIVLTPIRCQNLVELGKIYILFRLPNSFRASRRIQWSGSCRGQRPLPGCDGRTGCRFRTSKWKMRLLAFEWAQNRTVRVNSLEITELESCNFDCSFKSLFYSTPGSERVKLKISLIVSL